jgi:hypothetical protein
MDSFLEEDRCVCEGIYQVGVTLTGGEHLRWFAEVNHAQKRCQIGQKEVL